MAKTSLFDRWFPLPKSLVPPSAGVDISDASIRWLAFEQKRGTLRVAHWGELPLESGIVVDGVVRDIVRLSEALKTVKKNLGGIVCAHASLPEEAGYVFNMRVPDVSDRASVMDVIGFELEARVPIPAEDAVFDFDTTSSVDTNGHEIGVTVFAREFVDSYVAAFGAAGLRLLSLELEARSIARAVCPHGVRESVDLLVDFGRNRSGFAVLKGSVPIFTSTVSVGGESMTRAIMDKLSITPEAARTYNDEQGLTPDDASSAAVEVISGTASALADEVVRHYRYWDTRRNERGERVTPVGRILLVGGSANLRGLDDYIAARARASTMRPSVWSNVCSFDEYIPPIDRRTSLQFATTIGLALRGVSQ